MKKTIIFSLALVSGALLIQSCGDDDKKVQGCMDPNSISYNSAAEEDDGSCAYGGTGGSTTIVAKPQHHGVPIISKVGWVDSAFVKFNTQNSAGTNPANYDLVLAGEEGEDHVHIENMKPGKYYIYMTGFDSTIVQRVVGGIPVTITASSGEVDVEVPVSE